MNLQQMVQFASADARYLEFKSPRDPRVIEALGKVDRKEFLPLGVFDEREVIPEFLHYILEEAVKDLRGQRVGTQRDFTQEEAGGLLEMCEGILMLSSEAHVPVRDIAYDLSTPPIGYGQTCSDPGMVAVLADLLELQSGMRVLEIGTGCGYHAAVTAELVGSGGTVYSVERILPLAEMARTNLKRHFGEDHGKERVVVVHGDGSQGLPEHGPYDRIYFTAGVDDEHFSFSVVEQQLSPQGVCLYPEQRGHLIRIEKNGERTIGGIAQYGGGRVRFVPLMEGVALG